ncbi:MAG: hypothetical protein ACI82A_002389 [Candidatus Azotimanducaceae bacterium]|jgi:hypothetical protein
MQQNTIEHPVFSHPVTVQLLGYAGLVPFVLLAAAAVYSDLVLLQEILAVYSFGIFAFLTGSWWGIGLLRATPPVLVSCNLMFLVAAGLFIALEERDWFIASSGLFVLLYVLETRLQVFQRQPIYYRLLRGRLTLVVSASLLLVGVSLYLPGMSLAVPF